MRKVLLLSLSLALGFSAFAQQRAAKNDIFFIFFRYIQPWNGSLRDGLDTCSVSSGSK